MFFVNFLNLEKYKDNMEKFVIDSSIFSDYIVSEIVKDGLVCEIKKEPSRDYKELKETYICKDSKGNEVKIPSYLTKYFEERYGIKLEKYDNTARIIVPTDKKERFENIRKIVEDACRRECYITPDIGVSAKGQIRNPYVLLITGRDVYYDEDIWNETLRKSLEKLNAKILVDKDLEILIGKEGYERLSRFWDNFTGGRIYKDEENRIDPIVQVEIKEKTKDKEYKTKISAVYGKELNIISGPNKVTIPREMLEKHVAGKNMLESIIKGEYGVIEMDEASKRALLSKIQEGKLKEYYGIEGSIDFYLRAISRDPNVKIITKDKDIMKEVSIISKPDIRNIEFIP